MPQDGLSDSKLAIHIVKQRKFERPLSDQAKVLKTQIAEVIRELEDLKSFNPQDIINNRCDQLEIDLIEAVESARKHIDKIEDSWLKELKNYREKCLRFSTIELAKWHCYDKN